MLVQTCRSLAALFGLLVTMAAGPAVGPLNAIHGQWIIARVDFEPITAVTPSEVKSRLGKRVVLEAEEAVFAELACRTPRYVTKHENPDRMVRLICANGTIMPNFYATKRHALSAKLDGAIYDLERPQ